MKASSHKDNKMVCCLREQGCGCVSLGCCTGSSGPRYPHHTQIPLVWGTSLAEHRRGATMDIRVHHPQTGVNLPKADLEMGQITGSPFPGSRNLLPLCWLRFLSSSPRVRMRMSTCISPWPLTVKPPGGTSHIAGKLLTHLAARYQSGLTRRLQAL